MNRHRPLVLCLSGHDPGGGAGIHADIEAIGAQGAHALTVITALTVQDSHNVRRVMPVAATLLTEQLDCLLADSRIAAIKIGLLGSVEQLPVIVEVIRRCAVPVIADPVLAAGGGAALSDAPLRTALLEQLLPQVDLLTPNAGEARRLMPRAADAEAAAFELQALGARHVLVTGGDEATDAVHNLWLAADGHLQHFRWARVPARFHGAGCTLAAAIAGRVALGDDWATAIEHGQQYTQQALARAFATGQGRLTADRWPARAEPRP